MVAGININQKLMRSTNNQTGSKAAGTNESIIITPPVGQIGRLNNLGIYIPQIGGASGYQSVTISVGSDDSARLLYVNAPYGSDNLIQIIGLGVVRGTPSPSTDAAIASVLKNLRFDSANPLLIKYYNNTNVTQSTARSYTVQYVLEGEGVL